jgi:hypothetical protein
MIFPTDSKHPGFLFNEERERDPLPSREKKSQYNNQ